MSEQTLTTLNQIKNELARVKFCIFACGTFLAAGEIDSRIAIGALIFCGLMTCASLIFIKHDKEIEK